MRLLANQLKVCHGHETPCALQGIARHVPVLGVLAIHDVQKLAGREAQSVVDDARFVV